MFQSTLVRRRHRAAARTLAVALGVALVGAITVLWTQSVRQTEASERVAVPALGTPAPAPGAAAPPPGAAAPPLAAPPSPPPPDRARLSDAVDRVQAEAPITFQPAGTRLTAQGEQSVQRLIGPLRDAPATRVRVVGHAAVVRGDPATALRVSQARAEVVAAQLRAGGIAAERLEVAGAGDAQPLPSPVASRRVVVGVI
jgi:outer membrane protein OmpA-like peptidoglycan-associated protein